MHSAVSSQLNVDYRCEDKHVTTIMRGDDAGQDGILSHVKIF